MLDGEVDGSDVVDGELDGVDEESGTIEDDEELGVAVGVEVMEGEELVTVVMEVDVLDVGSFELKDGLGVLDEESGAADERETEVEDETVVFDEGSGILN